MKFKQELLNVFLYDYCHIQSNNFDHILCTLILNAKVMKNLWKNIKFFISKMSLSNMQEGEELDKSNIIL